MGRAHFSDPDKEKRSTEEGAAKSGGTQTLDFELFFLFLSGVAVFNKEHLENNALEAAVSEGYLELPK